MFKLPRSVTGQQPTGAPDTLRTVRPTFVAPAPTDPRATAHALGAHVIRLPRTFQARATKIDGTPVLISRNGLQVHVLVDSTVGVQEVIGWSAAQVAGLRGWIDAAATDPENQSELHLFLDKIGQGTGGRPIEAKHLTAPEAARLEHLHENARLGLSASIDPNLDNSYAATRATLGEAREVERLVALADTLEDGAASGDSEVARLAKLGDSLSDG